jgi:hypothetical protein
MLRIRRPLAVNSGPRDEALLMHQGPRDALSRSLLLHGDDMKRISQALLGIAAVGLISREQSDEAKSAGPKNVRQAIPGVITIYDARKQ